MKARALVVVIVLAVLALAGGGGFVAGRQMLFDSAGAKSEKAKTAEAAAHSHVKLGAEVVPGKPDTIRLEKGTAGALGLKLDTVEAAPESQTLKLSGTLFIDSNRLAYVHCRFPGEVIQMGQVPKTIGTGPSTSSSMRFVRIGDTVSENQVLAVIWSKEMGEKKSDLVDALSKLDASRTTLKRLEGLERGAVSEQTVRDARRQYESDLIAVERAERTLRSWKETDEEIAEVYRESERIRSAKGKDSADSASHSLESWANVEMRAPFSGTILEKNVSVGEIVDSTQVLFKIADLSRIGVLANVYEEDLPKLASLPPEQRKWHIHLKADPESPPIPGKFEVVGNIIDPGQHTAAVLGWISNPDNRLRVGQFITATVDINSSTQALVVPNAAIIDEGDEAFVFVSSGDGLEFTKRNVRILRRGRDRTLLAAEQDDAQHGHTALKVDDKVVVNGNLELLGVLQNSTETAAQ